MEFNTYQIITEILEPTTGTMLYSKVEPSISKFEIRRELLNDVVYFKEKVLDVRSELLTLETKEHHPSERNWYNYESFIHNKTNEIIHIDILDSGMEDLSSYVNCHIMFINNNNGTILYEFGSKNKK